MAAVPAVVTPETDQEHAATVAIRHRLPAVPVVDADGRLLGILPPEALMEVLRAEHLEDLHRISGASSTSRPATAAGMGRRSTP